jgi:hypothetical protein
MIVSINCHTNGKGHWSEEQRLVIINRLGIGYSSLNYYPEDPFHGELRAYFDPFGFTHGSWNVPGHGLIYTDRQWMKEFKVGMRAAGFSIRAVQNISYSEQGLQGSDYVSMDIGPVFYASWLRLQAKLKKDTNELAPASVEV